MTNDADTSRADAAARLAHSVGRLNRRIRYTGDLTPGQISALGTIVSSGPIRPGDLARVERVAAPTVTRLLTDLESRELVVRSSDPADGRSFFLSSTEAGVAAIEKARFERAQRVLEVFDELDAEQVAQLVGALDALEAASGMQPNEQ
jgi:DNA-binding MarR family transcriptional regulator